MGLLDDLKNVDNFENSRRFCGLCDLIANLPKEESKLLTERLADKKISHVAIEKILANNDMRLSSQIIGRHRRGICESVAKR